MRRYLALPMAGLLALAVAAPALAGPNVGNFSSSLTIAQASWDSYDEATQTFRGGYVAVSREQGAADAFADYSSYSEQYVVCDDGGTPADPSDDTVGVVWSNVFGYGPATLAIGKNNSVATASGTLELFRDGFDECTGEWTSEALPAAEFALELTATSVTIRESGRGSFHIPGEFNSHSSYKATYRMASGTVSGLDGLQSISNGLIGTVSWKDHSNG